MEVRRVKDEEYKRVDELFSISFSAKMEPDNSQPTSGEDVRYAAFENDEMISAIYVPRYLMSFDGNMVKMAGIGGVSTLPKYRRKGGIRAVFSKLLPDLYKEGFDFSYLYPFSTFYYRKFGYENACEIIHYTVNTEALPKSENTPKVIFLEESSRKYAADLIKKVYLYNCKKYNGMTSYTDEMFEWVEKEDPYKDCVYTYVYHNDETGSMGYISYSTQRDNEGLYVDVNRLMFTDSEAFCALMSVVRTYFADYKRTVFNLPMHTGVERLIEEWSFGYLKREIIPNGMVRVVNVHEVLSKARYKGSGEYSVSVRDSFIEENNRTFIVKFEKGRAVGIEEKALDERENCMPIEKFSRAVFGSVDIFDSNEVLYTKPMNIVTFF